MCDIERLKDSRDIFNTPFQKERDGEVFRSLKRVCYLMITIFFMLTFCFATRFQTIWEKMEFPADTTMPPFWFGTRCCCIGDVNGDGFDDFLVNRQSSNYYYEQDTTLGEYVFLHLGRKFLNVNPDLTFFHHHINAGYYYYSDGFGTLVMNGLGDVNGDGYDDFAIVAHCAITDTMSWGDIAQGGKIYVYFGGALLDTTPELVIKGHLLYSPPVWKGDRFPSAVCGSDVNGDGYKDIIIGFAEYSLTWNWYDRCRGRVYIYYGGPSI
jgi:hypothetical protein